MGVNSLPWYYIEDLAVMPGNALLTGEEWHHALHVLRMNIGESLILFDGKGKAVEGIIQKSTKNQGNIELIADRTNDFKSSSSLHINIAFAPTKSPDRTETAIEKIIELGVDAITFLDCKNGERSHIRTDRIKKIAIGAAKQSRKLFLPLLQDFISPINLAQQSKIQNPQTVIICCHPDAEALPLHHTYHGEENVVVLVGPEGGFSPEEVAQLKSIDIPMTTLGPHRLRVETAVISTCANIHLLHALKHNI
jgi:16S rRNA (uracil1498-N3)-methyltransferase